MAELGLFGVKFDIVDGDLCAVLTGDHYSGGEAIRAVSMSDKTSKDAHIAGSSPTYLARDTVVRVAMQMMDRMLRYGAVDCHDGRGGKPCGSCKACETTKREAFTHVLIGNLAVPGSDLHNRLDKAVRSTIGLAWTDSPWMEPFTEEEVEEVFEEMGVTPRKGKDK